MPTYEVVRSIPAFYTERYLVNASSSAEAMRAVTGGKARCTSREFATTPGVAGSAPGGPLTAREYAASEALPGVEPNYPAEFNNARFITPPGDPLQHVVSYPSDV